MLFTWDTQNLCIVFRQWRVDSTASLLISLIVVVLLGVGYEALRSASRRYETSLTKQVEALPSKYFAPHHALPLCRRVGDACSPILPSREGPC